MELVQIEAGSLTDEQKNTLKKLLDKAKDDFNNAIKIFIEQISNPIAKHQMIALIEESCCKRGRVDSYLRNWAKQDGTDMSAVKRDLDTFGKFNQFCTDLTNLLKRYYS